MLTALTGICPATEGRTGLKMPVVVCIGLSLAALRPSSASTILPCLSLDGHGLKAMVGSLP